MIFKHLMQLSDNIAKNNDTFYSNPTQVLAAARAIKNAR